ncbi:hypothetical protein AWZ03_004076 [Drosophila navojoa]|uniref:Uncharacterized protein n=1 Tax=Drosophila navojoa TaxID=7232 RepID=A0A484BNY5_DRONA|nr:hypothetical protein AWZ03_004076 [Drosophila navojoa]
MVTGFPGQKRAGYNRGDGVIDAGQVCQAPIHKNQQPTTTATQAAQQQPQWSIWDVNAALSLLAGSRPNGQKLPRRS